jgi:hypothetical protein
MGSYPITGVVEASRVKYGGAVQHTVKLDKKLTVYGAVRETVLVDNFDVSVVE